MNFEIDEQQRDFAASIDAALGAAGVPAAVRAWAEGEIESWRVQKYILQSPRPTSSR